MNPFLGLLIAIVALLANAFFVCAEFGLVSARRSNVEIEAKRGSKFAKTTLKGMEKISIMLAGAQLGVTVSSLMLGAVSEPAIAYLLTPVLEFLSVDSSLLHPISLIIALAITVFFHVVIGEMVPKNLALSSPTRIAILFTPPLMMFVKLTRPVVFSLNQIANFFLRLMKITPKQEIDSSFDRDELAGFVQESYREGLLSSEEEHMLSGVLNIENFKVKDVIISIEDIQAITRHSTNAQIEKVCAETGFSRFPVTDGRGIYVGYVHIKDIIDLSIKDYYSVISKENIRPLLSIPANTNLRKALSTMQTKGVHFAQIIDSKNKTVGFVALEDILEKIIGTIKDTGFTTVV